MFSSIIMQQYSPQDLKIRTERLYYLGFSLGKILDLGNSVNMVYTLTQLFEEYEAFSRQTSNLDQNVMLTNIYPESMQTISSFVQKQENRYAELETYAQSQKSKDNQGSDQIDTVRKPAHLQDSQSPNHLRGGGHINHHSQPPTTQAYEEQKVDIRAKSALLMPEHIAKTFEEYKAQNAQLGVQFSHQIGEVVQNRINAVKVDSKAPSFKVFTCQPLAIRLDYCEVASMMLDILILMYNKIFNDQFLNHFMYMQAEKIDNNIVNKILKTICDDMNKVARIVAYKQLAKINKVLKMDSITYSKSHDLKRVPSDDLNFQIPTLDLEGNNKSDQMLLNQVSVSIGQSGGQMK